MGRGAGRVLLLAMALLLALHATPASALTKSYLVMATQRPASWSALLTPITSQFRIFYTFDQINGIGLQIDAAFVPALKLLTGILVIENKLREVHTTHSWGSLGLEGPDGEPINKWENVANFGEGVIIANVDTGVSPKSPSFRDDGSLPTLSKLRWRGECEASPGCNNKLIGARLFNEGIKAMNGENGGVNGQQLNETDLNSPWDYVGHGTHTLSTAGGGFVPNVGAFGRGTGTAKGGSPRAHVASYKACFAPGCSDLDILMAILTAVADGVQVLSLSLGSPATDYLSDMMAIGTAFAVTQEVVVAAAAGNSGPVAGSVTNVAPWMLTVGASTMDRIFPADVVIGAKTITGQSLSNTNSNPFECSQGANHPEDLNYPSISVACLPHSDSIVTVKRRVMNVGGGAASYTASITQPAGVTVTVNPSTLIFDGENAEEEKHFTVTLQVHNAEEAAGYMFGSMEWSDGNHRVRSPIVATTKCV